MYDGGNTAFLLLYNIAVAFGIKNIIGIIEKSSRHPYNYDLKQHKMDALYSFLLVEVGPMSRHLSW